MALVKWDPFGSGLFPELAGLERRINHLTRQMLGSMGQEDLETVRQLSTPVDILARGDDLIVRAEMPGIDPEKDLEVTVDNGMLTIRGERRQEQVQEGEQYYRMERSYGSFARSIALPENVNEADIQARYENGILEVVVPRAAQIASRTKVPVQVEGAAKQAQIPEMAQAKTTEKPRPRKAS
ncbi:MAG: Hsp20/alpha crystallin family protein [Actinomycetota bacterium]|nr:Hsp20/alpha crystallin family protein [Actinomycetota bacterium]